MTQTRKFPLRTKTIGSSRYVGISRRRSDGRWCAETGSGVYKVHVGTFDTEDEAAEALVEYLRKRDAK